MYILRSTAVEFTPAQKINKLGAYRKIAETGMPWIAVLPTAGGGKSS
jgi:hypothetical protein